MNQVCLLNKSQKISVPWNFKAANIVLLTSRRYERILFHTPYCSVAKSCPTLWESMDCSTAGLPALHYLLEFVQTHAWTNLELFKLITLSWWCHLTTSSSVIPFSSCSQSYPASGLFHTPIPRKMPVSLLACAPRLTARPTCNSKSSCSFQDLESSVGPASKKRVAFPRTKPAIIICCGQNSPASKA